MEFKNGDLVKVKETTLNEKINGKTGRIIKIVGNIATLYFEEKIDTCWDNGHKWNIHVGEIEPYIPNKTDLYNMPLGTKITTDKYKHNVFIRTDKTTFENDDGNILLKEDVNNDLTINDEDLGTKITKIEVPKYITKYKDAEVKEMTINEISKALGYKVKIIEEK